MAEKLKINAEFKFFEFFNGVLNRVLRVLQGFYKGVLSVLGGFFAVVL
jgi:hypothetical protein